MVRRWLPWVLKGGLSVGLIVWVLQGIDLAEAWATAKAVDPAMLALATALSLVQIAIGAVRWHLVLVALSARAALIKTAAIFYIGVFFSMVLPGAVGGDAVRMFFARKTGLSLAHAINSVTLDRVTSLFTLFLLVTATQPFLTGGQMPGTWIAPALTVAGLAGIAVLTVLDRVPAELHRWAVVRGLASLAEDARRLFLRGRWATISLGTAVIGHINLVAIIWVLALGMGVDLPLIDALVLVPPVILIMTLPISIAGWGAREKAMQVFLGFAGVAEHMSVVVSVMFGLIAILVALPGGLVWLASGERRTAVAEVEAGAPTP